VARFGVPGGKLMRHGFIWRRRHSLVRTGLSRPIANQLTWDIRSRGNLITVVVAGELDVATVAGLDRQLRAPASLGRHLVLDLAGLRFCDCAGLSLFLQLQEIARAAGGSLHLVAPTAQLRRLIAATKLSDDLPVAPSLAETGARLQVVPPPRRAPALEGCGWPRVSEPH
jgi:anti-sigma B factor antagonist